MYSWMSDQERDPNQNAKKSQHDRHQTYGKQCLAIDENGKGRECKRNRGKYRPKHLARWNPLWNQASGLTKEKCLAQSK